MTAEGGEGPWRALGRSPAVVADHTGGGIGAGLAGLKEGPVLGLHVSDEPQQGGAGEGDNQSGAEARAAVKEGEHGLRAEGGPNRSGLATIMSPRARRLTTSRPHRCKS